MHWLWYTLPLVSLPGLERLLAGPTPPIQPPPPAGRVMAVAAHPDDLEYFCGGTLCRLARNGARITAVLATHGEQGGDPAQRRLEQERAAAILGIGRLCLLGFPDRGVRRHQADLAEALTNLMAEEQPDLLLTFDYRFPYPVYRHDDHQAVAEAALSVWTGPALLFHSRRPTLAVEITETFPVKIAAFAAHRSQLPAGGAPRLLGWHLDRRNRAAGRRYLEPFREGKGGS